jgi:hypothetical protein
MISDSKLSTFARNSLAPDLPWSGEQGRTVKRVISGGAMKDAVQFEFEFADGTRDRFCAAGSDFPKIVSNLRGYQSIVERGRRAGGGQPVDTANPYHASDAYADRVGAMVVIRYSTTDGLPLLIAMDGGIAAKLVQQLERAVAP